ncbi:O-antigen ligase family protein [Hujiaoplasma nucleasis]|uniref:O-antigen ligase family protein n=1 Tax=Hujiaoplasma nucleasis TaxID=2725268 RepID=A0A7L6N0R4_9MOLU|nr:O-antigen ligase family protein [Hujiaoplasma nucleasis]QLY39823.1 O-antigen ligase family protein [Hujiaoplasma nucleasis]
MQKTFTLFQLFIVSFALINYFDRIEKIYFALKSFVYGGLFAAIYVLLNIDLDNIRRFGDVLGNENTIGMIIATSSIFSLSFYLYSHKFKWILPLPLFITIVLLTGSRKATIFLMLGFLFIVFMKNKSNISQLLKTLFITTLIIVIFIFAVFSIEIFYNIIGQRLENLYYYLSSGETSEGSIISRARMTSYGFDWFLSKPLLGYGIDNYRVLYGNTFFEAKYSHNNFIELLVGVGIVGLFLYLMYYLGAIKNLIFNKNQITQDIRYSLLYVIFGYFALSSAMVFYDSKHITFILFISTSYTIVNNRENKKQKKLDSEEKL